MTRKIDCNTNFQGGSWALVRRTQQGSTWFPLEFEIITLVITISIKQSHTIISDNLSGVNAYGTYVADPLATSTFSVAFGTILSPSTQLLFATGDLAFVCIHRSLINSFLFIPIALSG